jgi:hypothetical protein
MTRSLALFLSGFFFGGAVDHFILALMNSPRTPYGVEWGVGGNWLLGLVDLLLTLACYGWYKRSALRPGAILPE